MIVILWAFTAFHFVVGLASLGLAVRLLSAEERAHWRSWPARVVAEVMCWVYPAAAFFAAVVVIVAGERWRGVRVFLRCGSEFFAAIDRNHADRGWPC